MFELYSNKTDIDNPEFRDVAEKYFHNYLIAWCEKNHIDPNSREQMIKVLYDYSNFFFDSLLHHENETLPDHSLKN